MFHGTRIPTTSIHRRRLLHVAGAGVCAALSGTGLPGRWPAGAQGTPAPSPAPVPAFHAGINVLAYGDGDDFGKRTDELLDRVAGVNANSVALSIPLYQDDGQASAIGRRDGSTPSDTSIARFAQAAHERGLAVMLRPFLDEASLDIANGEWRGNIAPADIAEWWRSYTATMLDLARVAEREQIQMLSLMVELTSRQADLDFVRALIGEVREVYPGQLTICFNWDAVDLAVADGLDFIGIDQFRPLNIPEDADPGLVRATWEALVAEAAALQEQAGKPVVWTEVGTIGSYNVPFAWSDANSVEVTDAKQATYLGELCGGPIAQIAGMYIWNMYFNEPDDLAKPLDAVDLSEPSFNIVGRPAEEVVRECYAALADEALQGAG